MLFRTRIAFLTLTLTFAVLCSTLLAAKSFGCRNSLISDEWRREVLDLHNSKRSILAKGKQKKEGDEDLPAAQLMYKLNWDCNMEEEARKAAAKCVDFAKDDYGIAQTTIAASPDACKIKEKTLEVLNEWWNQVTTNELADEKYNEDVKQFSVMAYSKVEGFACTYNYCKGPIRLLCIYDKNGAVDDEVLYEKATEADPFCSGCAAPSVCVNGLCEKEYKFVKFPAPLCENDGMTRDMQTMGENMHNYYRATLATGWAKGKTKHAPRARAMPALAYDCAGLGAQSKAKADDCAAETYEPDADNSLNFLKFDNFKIAPQDALEQAIATWWDQINLTNLNSKAKYTKYIKRKAPNFARMILDGADKIGCSVKNCMKQGFAVAVCQYNKKLVDNARLYKVGPPCSSCADDQQCAELGGLCTPPPAA